MSKKDDQKSAEADAAAGTNASASEETTITFLKLKPKPGLLVAKIYTPYKTFFEGDLKSLSALNDTGEFDVLPGHHNFITMLRPCSLRLQLPDKTTKSIPIARGLLHVRENIIIVFLDV